MAISTTIGATESHTGATGSSGETSFTWNAAATPATPQGVLIFVWADSDTNPVTSVTYAGKDVPAAASGEVNSGGTAEPGNVKVFFLGGNVPAGASQPIVVNRTNNGTEMWACCITLSAIGDTAIHTAGIVTLTGLGTYAVQSVTDGTPTENSLRFAGGHSGGANLLSPGVGSSAVLDFDTGNFTMTVVRETTAGTGARNVGFTFGTSDDRAGIHFAVKDLATAMTRAASESVPVGLTETATLAIRNNAADSLPGLAEATTLGLRFSASESVTVGVDDPDIAAFELTGLNEALTQLAEAKDLSINDMAGGATPVTASDSLAVGPTEATRTDATASASDPLAVHLDEPVLDYVQPSTNDSLAAGLTESVRLAVTLSTSDSVPLGLTEATALAVVLGATDALAAGLVDASLIAATQATNDLLTGLAEAATGFASTSASESLTGLAEASTLAQRLTASESLTVGLVESAFQAVTLIASDSLTIGLTESLRIIGTASAAESLTGLAEAATGLSTGIASELEPIGLTESLRVASTGIASEADSIGIADVAAVAVTLPATDSLPGLSETATGLSTGTASDSVMGLAESLRIAGTGTASDSLMGLAEASLVEDLTAALVDKAGAELIPVGPAESLKIVSTGSASDQLMAGLAEAWTTQVTQPISESEAVGLTEAATVAVIISTGESLRVQVTDASGVGVSLQTGDSLTAGQVEALTGFIAGSAADTVGGLVEEILLRVTQEASEGLRLGLADAGLMQDVTDTSAAVVSEQLHVGLSETALRVAYYGPGTLIVTTVEFLGGKTAEAQSGSTDAACTNMPKDAEWTEV